MNLPNAASTRSTPSLALWGASCLGVALLIAFVLFPLDLWQRAPAVMATAMARIDAMLSAAEYQCVIAVVGFVYFAALFAVRSRMRSSERWTAPGWWLAASLAIATLNYATSDSPTRMFVAWLGAMLTAYAVATWAQSRPHTMVHAWVIGLFLLLLGAAAITPKAEEFHHRYRGELRWSGPWDNPNVCGLLMSAGVILATGVLLTLARAYPRRPVTPAARSTRIVAIVLVIALGGALLRGLLLTYSRGAWVGTALALMYLLARHSLLRSNARAIAWVCWGRERWLPLATIAGSAIALACWHLADTHVPLARRVLSVANTADLSSQNRISAWKGTLQLMTEHPWLGVGWTQAETMYTQFYLPARLVEGAAIQTNDYLMLGATIGIPGLAAFVLYIMLSFARSRDELAEQACTVYVASVREDLKLTCRAAALVLVTGFALDGALFKWSAAATFAVLLELGSQPAT